MAKGSNDLNILLKSQVIKLRAELDVKGSLPTIKKQVDEITKKLESKPVKLKVKLDFTLSDLNKQLKEISSRIHNSKTLRPLKFKVEIDVQGSAKQIKEQLKDVHKTVDEFNKKYGEQIKRMQQTVQNSYKGANGFIGGGNSNLGFDFKAFSQEVENAKRQMKGMFGDGLFSSFETKDAQGNLTGFIAQLEKANGVVQKIRYQWDKESETFIPINQQTINTMEKHIHKASQSLRSLYADIEKLQSGTAKNALFRQYEELERQINKGTLSQDAVKDLQARIKDEQVLQQKIKEENQLLAEQKKLILDIRRARDKDWNKTMDVDRRQQYNSLMKDVETNPANLKMQRLELQKINDEANKRIRIEEESIKTTKKRLQTLQQLRKLESQTVSTDRASRALIEETRMMAQRAKSAQDWIKIQENLNRINTSRASEAMMDKSKDVFFKTEQRLRRLVDIGRITEQQFQDTMKKLPIIARNGILDLERTYAHYNRMLKKAEDEMKRSADRTKVLLNGSDSRLTGINRAVDAGDLTQLQQYIGQLVNGRVETIKVEDATDKLGRAVTRLKVTMAGTGKTVKTYTMDLDIANKQLRQVAQGMDYNANRNLGIMEQLRIAMARVPVWMTAMTAFYGTIRGVSAMVREILEVDKALTELRRVASDAINIERAFQGALELSKKLGNNVHDVMQTLNDFARTFGDFNERQLLAITETATLMANVSELTAQEAGETLIGTMNAFGILADESIRIADAMNEVDNNFAVSTKQLAEGMSKTASTAKTFGKVICRLAW